MELFWKTIKSLNSKERLASFFLLAIFFPSTISIILKDSNSFSQNTGSKIYTEALVGQITHLNPVYTELSDVDSDISSLIFSGLVRYNPKTKEFDEDIATHTLSEDKLIYTFTLKNGIIWEDGLEMTADDIYFTYVDVIQNENFKNPILKSNFQGVKIEQPNSRTITFTLNAPNSFFYSELTTGILPKHILQDTPVEDIDKSDFNKSPIGAGPYKVEGSYQTNSDSTSTVTLIRNDKYFGATPSIEKIRFIAYTNINELIDNRSVWHGAGRIKSSQIADIDTSDLSSISYELPQYTALFLNTDSKFLGKNKVRLAISKAIDKTQILSITSYTKQIDTPLLELNQNNWSNKYNLSESQGALFDSGWKFNEAEIFRKNADQETLSLRLIRRDFSNTNENQEKTFSDVSAVIAEQLKVVGIEVKIEAYEVAALNEIIINRDYDMLLSGQSLGYNLDTFSFWHSSQSNENGLNLSNYQNPKADYLIENIRKTFGQTEKEEDLTSLATVIADDVPAVFLFTPTYYYLVDKSISGINLENILLPKDRFANISEWIFN